MRWQPYVGSVAVHAVLIGIALHAGAAAPVEEPPARPAVELIDVSVAPPPEEQGGGGDGVRTRMALPEERPVQPHGISDDAPRITGIDDGRGIGGGVGNGIGAGIGTGRGNGLGAALDPDAQLRALPAPPPPPVSKARPAKLLHPTRQTEVDEAELFEARVTVDETGDVVGAAMMRSHPGSRGEVASSMIWQFRYSPALDDDGVPVRSTFVQAFAVR